MVSGRQLLWLVYQSYKLSQTSGALYSLVDLSNLRIKSEKGQRDDAPHSDKQLRWFVSSWDGLIAGMRTIPDDDILEDIFLRKIRGVSSLKEDLAYYDRLPAGHADRSFTFLKEACCRLLERKREHENRSAIEAHIASGGASVQQMLPAAPVKEKIKEKGKGKRGSTPKGSAKREPSKGVCYDYKNTGKCEKKDCPYLHKKEGSHSPGKGKGKGKKGKSPGAAKNKSILCKFFVSNGDCKFGADCHFLHPTPVAPAPVKKSRSRSRGGKKKNEGADPP
jgi:hypothetical protein